MSTQPEVQRPMRTGVSRLVHRASIVVAATVSAALLAPIPDAGAVNLTNDGQGGGAVGTIAGIVALVAMVAAAFVVQRRRDRRR